MKAILLIISLQCLSLEASASQYLYIPIENNQISIRDANTGEEIKRISMDTTNIPEDSKPIESSTDGDGNIVTGYITIIGDEDEIEVSSADKDKMDKIFISSPNKKHRNAIILDALDSYNSIQGSFLIRIISRGKGFGTIVTPSKNVFRSKDCKDKKNCQELIVNYNNNLKSNKYISATADENSNTDDIKCNLKKVDNQDYEYELDCRVTFNLIPTCQSNHDYDLLETNTTAIFRGGIYTDEDDYPQKDIKTNSLINICGVMRVDEYRGQNADILAVAMNNNTFYLLEEGNSDDFQKVWDGNFAHLYAFQKDVNLSEIRQKVNIYRGRLTEGLWYIYFGYRLDDGSITFNTEVLKIQIEG
jgi:hypothetical protein